MELVLYPVGVSERHTEPKLDSVSVCPNRTDIGSKPKTFFFKNHQESRWTPVLREEYPSRMMKRWTNPVKMVTPPAGDPSIHYTFLLHQSSQVSGQPFIVVETTRTSLPDTVVDHSSLLGNPRHDLSCWTFVLSRRSIGLLSEVQPVTGQLDSSSLHSWITTFPLKD